MAGLLLVSRAASFAADAHKDQHRKGAGLEPYVNHLAEVAMLLAEATGGDDAVLVAAGWLHDTVEDTAVTHRDIVDAFGDEVAAIVAEVTDDKSLPDAERKRLQIEHMPHICARAQRLKMADKSSNVRGVAHSPPTGWDRERLTAYVDWAEAVVNRATVRDAHLSAVFADAVRAARITTAAML